MSEKSIQPAAAEFMDHKSVTAHFGISRSHAYRLVDERAIKSVSIRKTGAIRGKRLFVASSIRDYLTSLIEPAK